MSNYNARTDSAAAAAAAAAASELQKMTFFLQLQRVGQVD